MKSLFIMGMSRGGTTVTLDLFRVVPGITVMNEANKADLVAAIMDGLSVVWKSPHDCLRGPGLKLIFPEIPQVYVIRDGRQNLAEHKYYIETCGIDPSFAPYQGPKGFAALWNKFAALTLQSEMSFRLEDLITGKGMKVISSLFKLCGYDGIEKSKDFWLKFVARKSENYPGEASDLSTPHWSKILTKREIGWIDPAMLKAHGYE